MEKEKILVLIQDEVKANFFIKLINMCKLINPKIEYCYITVQPKVSRYLKRHGERNFTLQQLIEMNKEIKVEIEKFEQFCLFEIKKNKKLKNKDLFKQVVEDYVSAYYFLFNKIFKPTKILIWNGEEIHNRTLKYVAMQEGIKDIYFFENGFFPDTMVVDNRGVNFSSSLKGFNFLEVDVDVEKLFNFKEQVQRIYLSKKDNPIFPNKVDKLDLIEVVYRGIDFVKKHLRLLSDSLYLESSPISLKENLLLRLEKAWYINKWEKIRNQEKKKFNIIKSKFKNYIFVPLQVPYDTQILINSDWIESMEELINLCLDTVPLDVAIVFKTHPAAFGKFSYRRYEKIVKNHDRVLLTHTLNTYELIKESSLVITINSTVGLEAILFDKDVIALGCAFWADNLAIPKVRSKEELKMCIFNFLEKRSNLEREMLKNKILFKVVFEYLKFISFKNPSDQQLFRLANELLNQ